MEISSNMLGASPLKARRKKFGIGSLIIMLGLGIVFTAAGTGIYNSSKISSSWQRVDGTVVSVTNVNSGHSGTTYTPTVSYQADGQTYKVTSSSSSSAYPIVGTTRQVAYDPSHPGDAKVVDGTSTEALLLVFPVVGVLLIILAPALFVHSLRRSEDINKLKQTGQKVQGIITDIQSNMNNSSQSGSNYRIIVSATAPNGTVQSYQSDWMSGLGGLAMANFRANPIPMDVYINPANPSDYYVDISEVPTMSPERVAELIRSAAHSFTPASVSVVQPPVQPSLPPQPVVPSMPQQAPPAPAQPVPPVMPEQPAQPPSQYPPQTY